MPLIHDPDLIEVKIYKYTVEPLDGKDAKAAYYRASDILLALGVRTWVAAGTALGLYRDGGFIPHDTDIDVETTQIDRFQDIKIAFVQNGYKIAREMFYCGIPMQIAFVHPDDNIIFDIYFYLWMIKDGVNANFNEHGILTIPNHFLEKMPLRHDVVSAFYPAPIEEYLTHRYGNWKEKTTEKGNWHEQAANLITEVKREDISPNPVME